MPAAVPHLKPVPSPGEWLEALFREHHDRVFRAAYRVAGDAGDAEDAVQTVFLRLARGDRALDLSPNPGSYLHRAGVNAALDLVRARKRSLTVAVDDVSDAALASDATSPEVDRADAEMAAVVRAAVAKLSPKAAEIFALRYFEGYDNHEIGNLVGSSHLVVGVLLHRARARVRQEIAAHLEESRA